MTSGLSSQRSKSDAAILDHEETLSNLMKLQNKSDIKILSQSKSKLEPAARKLLATWMLEVRISFLLSMNKY